MFLYSASALLSANGGPYWTATTGGTTVVYVDSSSGFVASPFSLLLSTSQNNYANPLIFQNSTIKTSLNIRSVFWTGLPLSGFFNLVPGGIVLSYCKADFSGAMPIPELPGKLSFNGISGDSGGNYLLNSPLALDFHNNIYAMTGVPWTICITGIKFAIQTPTPIIFTTTSFRPLMMMTFDVPAAL